ncbi:MAG: ImcF-related family protein, partial [Betaproteobacteria bacterium]
RNLVKDKIRATVDSLSAEEAWVLGERASGVGRTDPNQLTSEVLRRYFADFTAHWDGVLADIRLRKVSDSREALAFAQALAQPDSPLKRLIVAVNEQTQLGAGAAVASAATEAAGKEAAHAAEAQAAAAVSSAPSGLFGAQAVEAVVGSGAMAPDRVRELQLDEHFAALRRLAGDGKSGEYEVVALTLNEVAADLVAMQQRAASGVGLKEVPAGIVKAKAQADRFPQPVAGMLKQLVGFAEAEASGGLQREAKAGVGGAAANCARSIPGRYPFVRSSGQDAGIRDFELVFKPGGDLDAFFSGTLAPVVDRSGAVWRFKSTEATKAPVPASTLRQFQNADVIRTAFFAGGGLGFAADLIVAAADGEVTVDHDGAQTKLRPGSGVVRLVWPAKGSTRILLNGQPLVAADGAWALFRVVDKGTADPGVTGDRMRLTYAASAGRATLDLRVGSAAFNPFRLRELETFACPSMP